MFQSCIAGAYTSLCIQTECSQYKYLPAAATHDPNLMELIKLPYEWTCEANHSVSSTKQSVSSTWCWPALACVFDSVPTLHPTHKNTLAYPYGAFAVIFFIRIAVYLLVHLEKRTFKFKWSKFLHQSKYCNKIYCLCGLNLPLWKL